METRRIYLILDESPLEQTKEFTRELWNSEVTNIYAKIYDKRFQGSEIDKNIGDFLEELDSVDGCNRLILGQQSSLSKTEHLIRYMIQNRETKELAEFCCEDSDQNREAIESIFKKNFGYEFYRYPKRIVN